MYIIKSTNSWYNNRKFESLGEAKELADKLSLEGSMADIWSEVDHKESRCIYTPADCVAGQAIRGTYVK